MKNKTITTSIKQRCAWVPQDNLLYQEYHDKEWGVPVYEDRKHFEFLILEGAQAGLSWETILKRRAEYAKAFDNFDWEKVALYDEEKMEDLLNNPGIIRNRLKVQGAIVNAQCFIEVRKEFGSFNTYIWSFVNGKPIHHHYRSIKEIPTESDESRALSKDLRKRGFKFVGPTIMYAHMQAIGMVNDHTQDCFLYKPK
ncbi:MAG: DNA-3-methyladenine glycosylase [Chlamydiales bacterium 38-26]|nr:DNA-3-methyladenine glycosylase I [Chlamydiales bacterium]OJV11600.1 MAG: DNA-3-methyladenine glycosylase [Chlamydiales bacterium 38-26]